MSSQYVFRTHPSASGLLHQFWVPEDENLTEFVVLTLTR